MTLTPQSETFAFLADPATHGGAAVEVVHTHISAIFLANDRAYKLKRAVDLGFVDFSTLEKRRAACEKEVRVNALAAGALYLGVSPITRCTTGGLELGGAGEAVDYVVVMRRFDQDTLYDRRAARGELDRDEMLDLGRAVARFHAGAEIDRTRGGAAAIDATIDGNRASFLRYVPETFAAEEVEALTAKSKAALAEVAALLDARQKAGRVRRCHGDLHLRNICLFDSKPLLFDAIEFNDDFAVIDVLYDMAFLLMDLDSRGLRRLANIAFNHYLPHAEDWDGLPALPVFLSCRASIRAHVAAAMAGTQTDALEAARLCQEARRYFQLAEGYLSAERPRLVAVGGLSGSGKSRLARELAPRFGLAPGAVVLRTDIIRKRLLGVEVEDRLGEEGYSKEMSERTYAALHEQARRVLASGRSVVADAVFSKPAERDAIEAEARRAGVPFTGLWLEAPPEVMAERIRTRTRNPSDATVEVLNMQQKSDLGEMRWTRIDSGGNRDKTVEVGLHIVLEAFA